MSKIKKIRATMKKWTENEVTFKSEVENPHSKGLIFFLSKINFIDNK